MRQLGFVVVKPNMLSDPVFHILVPAKKFCIKTLHLGLIHHFLFRIFKLDT